MTRKKLQSKMIASKLSKQASLKWCYHVLPKQLILLVWSCMPKRLGLFSNGNSPTSCPSSRSPESHLLQTLSKLKNSANLGRKDLDGTTQLFDSVRNSETNVPPLPSAPQICFSLWGDQQPAARKISTSGTLPSELNTTLSNNCSSDIRTRAHTS